MSNKTMGLTEIEKKALNYFLKQREEAKKKILLIGSQELAKELNISRARAHVILSQLQEKRILEKMERKGFYLTSFGEHVLNELLHHQKILEIFCYEILGMSLEDSVNESENLVLHVSDLFISKLCAFIESPDYCPHGIKIPHETKQWSEAGIWDLNAPQSNNTS